MTAEPTGLCRRAEPSQTFDSELDNHAIPAKNTANSGGEALRAARALAARPESMTPTQFLPSQPPEKRSDMAQCKHPRVKIVAREEDSEFVECLECGEVFESSEFKDMDIEESKIEET